MSYRAFLVLCPVFLWCLCGAMAAGKEYWNYKTAYDAYDAGEFQLAADIYKRLAAKGDPRAQNDLGFMYLVGQGVAQQVETAAMWFRKAAAQGYAPALMHMATLYVEGKGVGRSAVEAHKFYSLAGVLGKTAGDRRIALSHRNEMAGQMTAAELAAARHGACLWWRSYSTRAPVTGGAWPPLLQYCAGD